MNLKRTINELIRLNRLYFLTCVSVCQPRDFEELQSCIDEIPEYRQDFTETLFVARKTNMCLQLYDLVDGLESDLGDDYETSPGARKILLKLIKEYGRIKVMRKIINGVRRAEQTIERECKEICRRSGITEEVAEEEIKKLLCLPMVSLTQLNQEGQNIFTGRATSPTGNIINF